MCRWPIENKRHTQIVDLVIVFTFILSFLSLSLSLSLSFSLISSHLQNNKTKRNFNKCSFFTQKCHWIKNRKKKKNSLSLIIFTFFFLRNYFPDCFIWYLILIKSRFDWLVSSYIFSLSFSINVVSSFHFLLFSVKIHNQKKKKKLWIGD